MQRTWKLVTGVIVLYTLLKHTIGTTGSDDNNITNSCILPPHPQFGSWIIYRTITSSSSDYSVPVGTILEVNCNDSYKLEGSALIACIRGKWKPDIGKCLRTCVSIHNTTITAVTCTYKGEHLNDCINPTVGTRARFQCAPFYEIQGLNKFPVKICYNGQWSGGLPECVPVCGKKGMTKDPTLIVGGFNTTSLEYPWQVALYENKSKLLICGGTLLNQKTILTAAHCVTNETAKLQPKENYIVAVGKTYRRYDDPRDTTTQISSIEQMYIPRQYKGYIQHYFGDIAIIIANKTFVLSLNVQPICVVWEKTFHRSLETPSKTNLNYVSGWGFTVEHKDPSSVLKSLRVPLITSDECERKLSEDDVEYLTDDKLCAGFIESNMSVCKGDSGGGLVSKYNGRYYIIAVVSIAPQATSVVGGCNSQLYSLYTKFSYYLEDFIIDIEARFRPYNENVDCADSHCIVPSTISRKTGCMLPDHPEFGYWSIYGTTSNNFMPGMLVASGTTLKIECQKNYTLTGHSGLFCDDEQWSSTIGQCLRNCTNNLSNTNDNEGCPPSHPACTMSKYGCCSDNITEAQGPDFKGCEKKVEEVSTTMTMTPREEEDCNNSTFGCCPDRVTPAKGSNYVGCKMPCSNSQFGCCPNGSTPAHGLSGEGCCLASSYGCCPDNILPARGPNLEECECLYSPYGCCPDNVTSARGHDNEGCGCQYSEHGCCPDEYTPPAGPKYRGCLCHTFQFGCCPDGITVAKGPHQLEAFTTKWSNDRNLTQLGNLACGCDSSKYGCCPNGTTEAKGDNFKGCENVPKYSQKSCTQTKERGSCRAYTTEWYFDMEYGGCSRFWYGGCDGNANRFKTKEECESICVKPEGIDRCKLSKVRGPCEGNISQWFYDAEGNNCTQFIYGGCLGNNNRFETREECLSLCVKNDSVDACEQDKDKGPCEGNYLRWYHDKASKTCLEFIYGGCKANSNNFRTEEACKLACKQHRIQPARRKGVLEHCSLPRVQGNCTGREPRWYYDVSENRCLPFYYSGCNGNGNNFNTEEACETDCPKQIEKDLCQLAADVGSCGNYTTRWYYDTTEKNCYQFYYGGCGGNGNNFETHQQCEERCEKRLSLRVTKPSQTSEEPLTVPVKANITSKSQRYPINAEILIHCSDGYPAPRVKWYKDGMTIVPSGRIGISDDNSLTIKNASKTDAGGYQCEAGNDNLTTSSSVTIVIDEIYIHPNCTNNSFFANCALIVQAKYCSNKYYSRICCKACTEAGLLPVKWV